MNCPKTRYCLLNCCLGPDAPTGNGTSGGHHRGDPHRLDQLVLRGAQVYGPLCVIVLTELHLIGMRYCEGNEFFHFRRQRATRRCI